MRIDVHWRSSRLSALSLMCRKATLAIALVALTAAGVHAAHVPRRRSCTGTPPPRPAPRQHAMRRPRPAGLPPRRRTPALKPRQALRRRPRPTRPGARSGASARINSRCGAMQTSTWSLRGSPPAHSANPRFIQRRKLAPPRRWNLHRPLPFSCCGPGQQRNPRQRNCSSLKPRPQTPSPPTPGRSQPRCEFHSAPMPAPLRGSHESLERQNARLDAEGLERIEDESDLADRIAHKLLVPIPASSALTVNADLSAPTAIAGRGRRFSSLTSRGRTTRHSTGRSK